jgi:F-type H+-transporting ATPase subunit a
VSDKGFTPPSPSDFVFPAVVGGITKPIILVAFSVVIISGLFWLSARRAAMVPGKLQFAGEGVYGFVRNGIARDVIGPEFSRFAPYLSTLFCFILVNNLFGIIPFIQFPTMSRIGFPAALAIATWLVFNYVGVRRQGLGRYLKASLFPPGVPKPVYLVLTPIELLTLIITRPLTLGLRLFANMFAGHLLLLLFILGGEYLLVEGNLFQQIISPFAFGFGILLTFFEALVQVLQAYIFTLLTALYIAGALADDH